MFGLKRRISTSAKVQIFFWIDQTRTWDGLGTDLEQNFAKNFDKTGGLGVKSC